MCRMLRERLTDVNNTTRALMAASRKIRRRITELGVSFRNAAFMPSGGSLQPTPSPLVIATHRHSPMGTRLAL